MADSDGEEADAVSYKRPSTFGYGLKKKGIKFVKEAEETDIAPLQPLNNGLSIADKYLALVLETPPPLSGNSSPSSKGLESASALCKVCKLPIDPAQSQVHTTTLAHQVCLQHIHPPSSIDRTRKGFTLLQSYGWDADSRLGLGAAGQGIRHPIQVSEKKDKTGIGDKSRSVTPKVDVAKVQKEPQGLGPKQVRKLEVAKKKRDERLREMFYRDESVVKYLGEES